MGEPKDWRDQDPIAMAVRMARLGERCRAVAPLAVELGDLGDRHGFDLVAHLHAQRAWSLQTFGPGTAPDNSAFEQYANAALSGPSNDQDLTEIAGVLLVLLDGAMRAGHEPEAVAAALAETLRINQSRRWPSPGSVPEGEAVEHEEGGE